MLSELLTREGEAFIFREPNLGRGRFELKEADIAMFGAVGIDLEAFKRRWTGWRKRRLVRGFAGELVPRMLGHMRQVGVKEIFHDHWRKYWKAFPGMRVVVLGRDPRDIYLSMCDRRDRGIKGLEWVDDTQAAAENLVTQFGFQLEMLEACGGMRVTYESLCAGGDAFEKVRRFVGSPISEAGRVGQFNEGEVQRTGEAAVHGGAVTKQRVERWRDEAEGPRLERAHRVFELMGEYAAFWGYQASDCA